VRHAHVIGVCSSEVGRFPSWLASWSGRRLSRGRHGRDRVVGPEEIVRVVASLHCL
jgi:hypothetical protein